MFPYQEPVVLTTKPQKESNQIEMPLDTGSKTCNDLFFLALCRDRHNREINVNEYEWFKLFFKTLLFGNIRLQHRLECLNILIESLMYNS